MPATATPSGAPLEGGHALRVLAVASLAAALLGAALELLAGPSYRLGWLSLGVGIQTMRWAATGAAVGAGLGLVAAVWPARAHVRRARIAGIAALVIGLVAAGPPAYLWRQVQHLPRIHDISTDTAHPPAFVAVLPLRRGAPNGSDYAPAVAAQQREGYPDIAPLVLENVTPAQAFDRARQAARAMGWAIVAEAPQDGRIEATATSLLFGFKDDVVVRIASQGVGSRVDVRSVSRVGGSDFGVNAQRVRAFLQRLAS